MDLRVALTIASWTLFHCSAAFKAVVDVAVCAAVGWSFSSTSPVGRPRVLHVRFFSSSKRLLSHTPRQACPQKYPSIHAPMRTHPCSTCVRDEFFIASLYAGLGS